MKKVRIYPEGRVPYGKTSTNEDALVALLSRRGLKWGDESAIRSVLRTIGYYRLTGYLHPFRNADAETYREGTNLDLVWRLYSFDRRMRLVVADALARIEISLRARIVDVHTAAYKGDPFVYVKHEALPKFSPSRFEKFLKGITDAVNRAEGEDEPAVVHFRRTYSDEHLPIWTAMEYLSFGDVTTYYEGVLPELKEGRAERPLGLCCAQSGNPLYDRFHGFVALRVAHPRHPSSIEVDVPREITPRRLSRSAAFRNGLPRQLAKSRPLAVVLPFQSHFAACLATSPQGKRRLAASALVNDNGEAESFPLQKEKSLRVGNVAVDRATTPMPLKDAAGRKAIAA